MTTIAWRLAHLIVGFAEMNGTHFDGPPTHIASFNYAGTAKEALRPLDDTHDMWVKGVRSLGNAGLARPQARRFRPSSPAPMARLALYTSLEVFHHGAEICLLRDLYLRNRSKQRDGASRPSPSNSGG